MKRAIWVSVAVIVAVTLLVVAGARSLLVDDQPTGDPVAVEKQVPQRPDCPAGLDLPCLGGDVAGEAKEVTVVNVWAWWCQPCRADLPSYQDDSGAFAAEQGLPPVVPVTVVLRGGEQVAVFAREFTSAEELAAAVEGAL